MNDDGSVPGGTPRPITSALPPEAFHRPPTPPRAPPPPRSGSESHGGLGLGDLLAMVQEQGSSIAALQRQMVVEKTQRIALEVRLSARDQGRGPRKPDGSEQDGVSAINRASAAVALALAAERGAKCRAVLSKQRRTSLQSECKSRRCHSITKHSGHRRGFRAHRRSRPSFKTAQGLFVKEIVAHFQETTEMLGQMAACLCSRPGKAYVSVGTDGH